MQNWWIDKLKYVFNETKKSSYVSPLRVGLQVPMLNSNQI